MSDREFKNKLIEAKKRVIGMDEIDGFADRNPGTICEALYTGVQRGNESCVFDALFMLLDVSGQLNRCK
jgi:hypothetical protein